MGGSDDGFVYADEDERRYKSLADAHDSLWADYKKLKAELEAAKKELAEKWAMNVGQCLRCGRHLPVQKFCSECVYVAGKPDTEYKCNGTGRIEGIGEEKKG